MQWKSLLCAVWILSPLSLIAQVSRKGNTDGKKIAMREAGETRLVGRPGAADSIKPMPFTMNGNGKVISINQDARTKIARGKDDENSGVKTDLPKAPKLALAPAAARPLDRIMEVNDKFKSVPLAGETDYFGNMNGYMVDYVKKYMTNFGDRLNHVSGRGASTFEVIDRVLRSHSIPKELKYLAVIESALNKNARSPVGAVGYWQFMESTARLMGLSVNGRRDERTDLSKSTHAAAKYLSYLYDQLDDWLLVVAAYNSGPRPVINAMKRTGKEDFWSIKSYLPKETQNHVLAFVATATIMERLNHFLLPGIPSNFDWSSLNVSGSGAKVKKAANPLLSKFTEDEVKRMAIVRIKAPLDLEVVSQMLETDRRQLGRWNYDYFDYLETYKTGNVYNFRIPKDRLDVFLEKLDAMEKASAKVQY
ncbi:lytic transglycosylase domain-containing protein [Taibaiella helva]|uniref:lytic transglycosylase domain-containing protein n=1 Tax=Taibaiella helva TaxID=2301235 RepID=UPI000E57387F|nr:lytic transglycosylase domain-containing protein [Taibaiella helva]